MFIFPLGRSLVPDADVLDAAATWEPGFDNENIYTPDPRQVARWRGSFTVTASLYDRIDFVDTGTRVCTLDAGTYSSPAEFAAEIVTKMNAAGGATDYAVRQLQGTTNRHHWQIYRTGGGSFALPLATGTNVARSVLRYLLGFIPTDRSAAATHTGEFAAVHAPYDALTLDLYTTKPANCAVLVCPKVSPAARIQLGYGASTAVSDGSIDFGDAADDVIRFVRFTVPTTVGSVPTGARYWQLRIADPRRIAFPRTGVGLFAFGMGLDLDASDTFDRLTWEVSSYAVEPQIRYAAETTQDGQTTVVERAPGKMIAVAFQSAPGLGQSARDGLENVVSAIGTEGYFVLSLDSREPNREAYLVRLTGAPTWGQTGGEGVRGRATWTAQFERMPL